MATKTKITKEEMTVFLKDHTNKEAAKHFNVSVRTIAKKVKDYGLNYYTLKYGDYPKELSDFQKDVVDGTLLGDASIHKDGRYSFSQCDDHKGYVEHVRDIMKPFSRELYEKYTKKPNNINGKVFDINHWNGEYFKSWGIFTTRSYIFKELRVKWYPDGKQVPKDLILNERKVAYWFMDDGTNNYAKRSASFATQGFNLTDINYLIEQLGKLGIVSTYQKGGNRKHVIAVSCRDYFKFMEMITPYIVDCMKYKVDVSKAMVAKSCGAGKLNFLKAREIRQLYYNGEHTQKEIAKIYDVSVATIWRVINQRIYPESNMGLGGCADYFVSVP